MNVRSIPTSQRFGFCLLGLIALILSTSCMRIEPTHPYDPDSPPEYRAPASLISAIYSPTIPQGFDHSIFTVTLDAANFDGIYTRRPESNGQFRFDGIPPGVYYLSIEGEVEGELYQLLDREMFLPVGEIVKTPFFVVQPEA